MRKLIPFAVAASLAASMSIFAAAAVAADAVGTQVQVSGEKIDSGLGDLPHYSKWADPTGRNPLQARVAAESSDKRSTEASGNRDVNPPQRLAAQVAQAK
jgi:hypothetical protein